MKDGTRFGKNGLGWTGASFCSLLLNNGMGDINNVRDAFSISPCCWQKHNDNTPAAARAAACVWRGGWLVRWRGRRQALCPTCLPHSTTSLPPTLCLAFVRARLVRLCAFAFALSFSTFYLAGGRQLPSWATLLVRFNAHPLPLCLQKRTPATLFSLLFLTTRFTHLRCCAHLAHNGVRALVGNHALHGKTDAYLSCCNQQEPQAPACLLASITSISCSSSSFMGISIFSVFGTGTKQKMRTT